MDALTEPKTTPAVLLHTARRVPHQPAVVEGDSVTTYQELLKLVERAARAYYASDVRPGDRVAIWAPNKLNFIVAMLGAQFLGASVVPLNTRYRGQEAHAILQRSRSKLLVLCNGFLGIDYESLLEKGSGNDQGADHDAQPLAGLPDLREIIDIGDERGSATPWLTFLERASLTDPSIARDLANKVGEDDLCDILFTSGTTGVPKGVMSAHLQTVGVALAWAAGAKLTTADRYAIVNPFFHGFGYKAGLIPSLITGATMYPLSTFDADSLFKLIEAERITVLPGSPTIFMSLIDHPDRERYDLSSLRFSIAGAASVPESLFADMRNILGFQEVGQAYGLTECIVATQSRENENPEHVQETTGPAIKGVEVRIVGPNGEELPIGEDGEIMLRGELVMLGYFEDPEATTAAFDKDGWFHTGDVGRLDEHGCLKITDRIKDMFTVGGFNVYPAEVENVLREHPAVNESAVVAMADDRLGSVGKAFVLIFHDVEPKPAPEELIAFCKERLANFKVPRKVVIVESFERNAMGKILKTVLR